jgi:hypothetical protein
MKNYQLFLILSCFILSCSPNNNNNSNEPKTTIPTNINPPLDTIQTINQTNKNRSEKIYSILEDFLNQVRDTPYQKLIYADSLKQEVKYLKFFPQDDLSKITLYLKTKAANYKRIKYTDIFLTSIEYETDASAKEAFNNMKKRCKFIIAPAARGSLDDDIEYEVLQDIDPYFGSFLVRKDNFIFSLRKSCGGNELLLSFKEYENLFLEVLDLKNSDIELIKSTCGDAQFRVKKIDR